MPESENGLFVEQLEFRLKMTRQEYRYMIDISKLINLVHLVRFQKHFQEMFQEKEKEIVLKKFYVYQ